MKLKYAMCLANSSSTTWCILVPAERERKRERESHLCCLCINYLLMILDSPIFCHIGQVYCL